MIFFNKKHLYSVLNVLFLLLGTFNIREESIHKYLPVAVSWTINTEGIVTLKQS